MDGDDTNVHVPCHVTNDRHVRRKCNRSGGTRGPVTGRVRVRGMPSRARGEAGETVRPANTDIAR